MRRPVRRHRKGSPERGPQSFEAVLRLDSSQWFESVWVDLSSHNANPPGVFDGEAVPLPDMADTRIAEAVAALRRFVAEHGSIPTSESWTEAAMRPSEKTIRRRFGSFREAIQRAALP